MKLVYEKAASLCVAAGYTHYTILDQESQAGQQYESANASVRVQLYLEDGEGRLGCEAGASAEYVAEAREKLARRGYAAPEPAAIEAAAEGGGEDGSVSTSCTVEQIAAMVRAG